MVNYFMSKKVRLQKIEGIILPLLKRNSVVQAGIFGSFARGEETKKSDIDVLVKFGKRKSLLDLVRLERELKKATGRKVEVLTYKSIHPLLKERILKEEVRIL